MLGVGIKDQENYARNYNIVGSRHG